MYQWIVFQVINTVFLHGSLGRSGRGHWRVSSAAIGRAPQKAGPKQPPTTHAYSLHQFTSFLKAVRKALCLYCGQTTRGEELQEHKASETLETKPRTSFLIIVAKIFRSRAHWLVSDTCLLAVCDLFVFMKVLLICIIYKIRKQK